MLHPTEPGCVSSGDNLPRMRQRAERQQRRQPWRHKIPRVAIGVTGWRPGPVRMRDKHSKQSRTGFARMGVRMGLLWQHKAMSHKQPQGGPCGGVKRRQLRSAGCYGFPRQFSASAQCVSSVGCRR